MRKVVGEEVLPPLLGEAKLCLSACCHASGWLARGASVRNVAGHPSCLRELFVLDMLLLHKNYSATWRSNLLYQAEH